MATYRFEVRRDGSGADVYVYKHEAFAYAGALAATHGTDATVVDRKARIGQPNAWSISPRGVVRVTSTR